MGKYINFNKVLGYIDDNKQETIFRDKKGTEVPGILSKRNMRDKLLIASGEKERVVMVKLRDHYHVLRFAGNQFVGEKGLRSLKRYIKDEYQFSCHRLMLHEFFDWFEENKFLDEEVTIARNDLQILKKHKIEVPNETTTRRKLQEKLEKVLKEPEKEEAKKVATKYIRGRRQRAVDSVMTMNFEKALKKRDEEMLDIHAQDSQIFTKYGIKFKPEQTSFKDFQTAIHKANKSQTFTLKTISEQDLEVFKKYGIKLTPTGEVVGRVKPPKARMAKITVFMICLLAGVMIWRFSGDRIMFFVDDFINTQKNKIEARRVVRNLQEQEVILSGKMKESDDLYQLFTGKYPIVAARKELPAAIEKKISSIRKESEAVTLLVKQGETLLSQKRYSEALEKLKGRDKAEKLKKSIETIQIVQKDLNDFVEQKLREDCFDIDKTFENKKQKFIEGKIDSDSFNMREYYQMLHFQTKASADWIEEMEKNYSIAEDYVIPHPQILVCIEDGQQQGKAMLELLNEGQALLAEKKLVEAVKWFDKNRKYPREHVKNLRIMRRVYRTIKILTQTNRGLRKQFLAVEKTRKAARDMGNYIFEGEEWLHALEEKLAIIEEDYPFAQKQLPIDNKVFDTIKRQRTKVDNLKRAISQVDEIFRVSTQVDYAKIEQIVDPYKDLDVNDLEELQTTADSLDIYLQGLKKLGSKESLTHYENMLGILGKRHSEWKTALDKSKHKLADAEKVAKEFKLSLPANEAQSVFEKVEREIATLDKAIKDGKVYIEERNLAQLQKNIVPLVSEETTVETDLQELNGKLDGIVQTGETLKVDRSKRALEFSQMRITFQTSIAKLNNSLAKTSKKASTLSKKYPQTDGFPLKSSRYKSSTSRAKSLLKKLGSALASAEGKLKRKDILAAHKTLDDLSAEISNALKIIDQLNILEKEIDKRGRISAKKKAESKKLARINRVLRKIDEYTKNLQGLLKPVEKDVEKLAREFPSSKGFPQLSPAAQKILKNARAKLAFYRKKNNMARSLIKKKKLDDALALLKPYEGKTLSQKSFSRDLRTLQNEVHDTLTKAQIFLRNKDKVSESERYLTEIRERRDLLKKILPQLKSNISKLGGATSIDPQLPNYIKDGEFELDDLGSLIKESEELMKKNNFKEVVQLLKPYTASKNPDIITGLKILEAYWKKTNNELAIANDPEKQRQIAEERRKKAEREKRLARFTRAPGQWYKTLQPIIDKYERIKPGLSKSLKGHGARFIQSRIEIEVSGVKSYPEEFAILEDMRDLIERNGKSINEVKLTPYRKKVLKDYVKNKAIEIEINNETQTLKTAVNQLESELQMGGWVNDETLKSFLREIKSVDRKYKDSYQMIEAPLLSLKSDLPN